MRRKDANNGRVAFSAAKTSLGYGQPSEQKPTQIDVPLDLQEGVLIAHRHGGKCTAHKEDSWPATGGCGEAPCEADPAD